MQITTGIGDYNKITLGDKDYSYIKMTTTGFNLIFDKQNTATASTNGKQGTLPAERPSYNMKPSEMSKTTYTENNINYTKYQFHELQTKQNGAPYADTRETTGTARIELVVKTDEADDFEDYIYYIDEYKLTDVTWISQYDKKIDGVKDSYGGCTWCATGHNKCCLVTSKYIVNNHGGNARNTSRLKLAVLNDPEDPESGLTPRNFEAGKKIIDDNIRNGIPVVVGVNNSLITSIYNSFNTATHHFIVIVGKGTDKVKNQEFYYFHEVGTSQEPIGNGLSHNNRLYINETAQLISGDRPYGALATYTITEVFKNN